MQIVEPDGCLVIRAGAGYGLRCPGTLFADRVISLSPGRPGAHTG
jgi:hypothetical protein